MGIGRTLLLGTACVAGGFALGAFAVGEVAWRFGYQQGKLFQMDSVSYWLGSRLDEAAYLASLTDFNRFASGMSEQVEYALRCIAARDWRDVVLRLAREDRFMEIFDI